MATYHNTFGMRLSHLHTINYWFLSLPVKTTFVVKEDYHWPQKTTADDRSNVRTMKQKPPNNVSQIHKKIKILKWWCSKNAHRHWCLFSGFWCRLRTWRTHQCQLSWLQDVWQPVWGSWWNVSLPLKPQCHPQTISHSNSSETTANAHWYFQCFWETLEMFVSKRSSSDS